MTKWVNPVTTTNDADIKLVHDADIKLVHTDNTDVIANACRKIAELEKENEEMKKGLGCETCQIHLEYMRLNDKINNLEKENRLLGERCNQLLKDKGDLIDQIKKMKCCANCSKWLDCECEEPTDVCNNWVKE